MLRFVLFGYPVRVHWMFWILCVLIGWHFLDQGGRENFIFFIITAAVVFGSILWHELGHAWARKRVGQPNSEIMLHGMGGLCMGPGYLTRRQTIFVAGMGPAASLALGAATLLLLLAPGIQTNATLAVFVNVMLFVNIGWSILNLLPVMPLDGGQIFDALMANRNPGVVPKVGMIVAGMVAVAGFLLGHIWMGFLFGFLAYQNYRRVQGMQGTRRAPW